MTGTPRPHDPTDTDPARQELDDRLHDAAINADTILEPAETDPREIVSLDAPPAPEPHGLPTIQPQGPALPQTAPARPFARTDGVRLMPLAGFVWGAGAQMRAAPRAAAAQPRVRGDHVILLVTSGGVEIEFPRKRQLVGQGRIAFIPAGTAFSLLPPPEIEGRALLLPPNLGLGLPVGFPLVFQQGVPHPADEGLLEPAFCALGQDRAQGPRGSSATALQLGLLALALSRAVDRPQIQDADLSQRMVARPLTDRFLDLAANHLADGRTIADMAMELGCTQAQLDRACSESRGRSPLELLYALRVDRAAELLRGSDLPITAIAQEVGYSSIGHFTRVFAAATGRNPEAFRALKWRDPGSGE